MPVHNFSQKKRARASLNTYHDFKLLSAEEKKKENAMKLKSFLIRTWLTFLLCIISCSNTPHVDYQLELIRLRMVCSGKLHHGADQSKLILGWFWATALKSVKTGKRKWSFDLCWSVDGFVEITLWKMCSARVANIPGPTTKAMKRRQKFIKLIMTLKTMWIIIAEKGFGAAESVLKGFSIIIILSIFLAAMLIYSTWRAFVGSI